MPPEEDDTPARTSSHPSVPTTTPANRPRGRLLLRIMILLLVLLGLAALAGYLYFAWLMRGISGPYY